MPRHSLVVLSAVAAIAMVFPPTETLAETPVSPLGATPTTPPAEPLAPLACRSTTLNGRGTHLFGVPGQVAFKHGNVFGLPKGAQTLVYGQGRRFTLPADSTAWTTTADLPIGTYEIGLAEAGGARWISPTRARVNVIGSRRAKFRVTEKLPCEVDAAPGETGWVVAAGNGLTPHVAVRRQSMVTDTTGVMSVLYEGEGIVPLGRLQLTHAPSVSATIWSTPGYATTSACRARQRSASPQSMRNMPVGAPSSTTWDAPAGNAGAVFTYEYTAAWPKAPEMIDAELARSPMPGSLCPTEP